MATRAMEDRIEELYEHIDYVVDRFDTPDFVEIVAVTGGDYTRYRIFKDGRIGIK